MAPTRFVGDLRTLPLTDLPGILVQFMFAYLENTYFGAEWWNSLKREQQRIVTALALMPDAYYGQWGYEKGVTVPWDVRYVSEAWQG
jgi:hypothetical protein